LALTAQRPAATVSAPGAAAPAQATPAEATPTAAPSPESPTEAERSPQPSASRERRERSSRERRASADDGRADSNKTFGSLAISSVPGSYVTIDGRDTGRNTPLLRYPIAPGNHEIRLRTPAGATHVQRIEVRPGQTVRVYHRF